jgi:hypothetical protein
MVDSGSWIFEKSPIFALFRVEGIEAKKRRNNYFLFSFQRQFSGIYTYILRVRPRDVLEADVWTGARGGCMIGDPVRQDRRQLTVSYLTSYLLEIDSSFQTDLVPY